ncbi:XRE family transcriptional regulator [Carnobacterium sp. ISL-102]|uniref:XRE family transcriptional regulator n=1 Tax=Carnobacterium sp. ISL-102 TaxID=2819142 RepID=UPI001BEAFF33|nr:XRE family transcriptional regulator [Carnobacterium sp. ISL-102]MBT2732083.1 XRE family transcriptional regulator [Carnobacterium sp. ISL-102]
MLRITLEAARINAKLTQKETAEKLDDILNEKVTRQRVAYFEKKPEETPIKYADAFSQIYDISKDHIFFNSKST